MNRTRLISASVMVLLVVSGFVYGTSAQAALPWNAASGSESGFNVQYAQFRPPGLFDRGTCEFSCRSVYGEPGAWTGDRYQSGSNLDYLRCANQCDIRNWSELDRLRKQY